MRRSGQRVLVAFWVSPIHFIKSDFDSIMSKPWAFDGSRLNGQRRPRERVKRLQRNDAHLFIDEQESGWNGTEETGRSVRTETQVSIGRSRLFSSRKRKTKIKECSEGEICKNPSSSPDHGEREGGADKKRSTSQGLRPRDTPFLHVLDNFRRSGGRGCNPGGSIRNR